MVANSTVVDAWHILRQFVEPGLQALGDAEGTQEVWAALRIVEAGLGVPPKLPRPKGWVSKPTNVAVVKQEITKPSKPRKVAAKAKPVTKKVTKTKRAAR